MTLEETRASMNKIRLTFDAAVITIERLCELAVTLRETITILKEK